MNNKILNNNYNNNNNNYNNKAKIAKTNELVAIKVIRLEPGEDLTNILNEINFLRSCEHQNIVSYKGCYMRKGNIKGQNFIWVK